jgi:hypothetical protein
MRSAIYDNHSTENVHSKNGWIGRNYEWNVELYAKNLGYFKVKYLTEPSKSRENWQTINKETPSLRGKNTRN